jgi:hypothetical protein
MAASPIGLLVLGAIAVTLALLFFRMRASLAAKLSVTGLAPKLVSAWLVVIVALMLLLGAVVVSIGVLRLVSRI